MLFLLCFNNNEHTVSVNICFCTVHVNCKCAIHCSDPVGFVTGNSACKMSFPKVPFIGPRVNWNKTERINFLFIHAQYDL